MSHPEFFLFLGKEVRSTEISVTPRQIGVTRCEAPKYVAIFRCFAPRDVLVSKIYKYFGASHLVIHWFTKSTTNISVLRTS